MPAFACRTPTQSHKCLPFTPRNLRSLSLTLSLPDAHCDRQCVPCTPCSSIAHHTLTYFTSHSCTSHPALAPLQAAPRSWSPATCTAATRSMRRTTPCSTRWRECVSTRSRYTDQRVCAADRMHLGSRGWHAFAQQRMGTVRVYSEQDCRLSVTASWCRLHAAIP
jgi:hypothetical protein